MSTPLKAEQIENLRTKNSHTDKDEKSFLKANFLDRKLRIVVGKLEIKFKLIVLKL